MAFVSATSTHQFAVDDVTFRSIVLGLQHAIVATVALGVKVRDQLIFRETVPNPPALAFTDQWVCRQCKHVLLGGEGTGIVPGFVVLSINNASENEWATARIKRRLSLAERMGLSPARFWAFEEAREMDRRETARLQGTSSGRVAE